MKVESQCSKMAQGNESREQEVPASLASAKMISFYYQINEKLNWSVLFFKEMCLAANY